MNTLNITPETFGLTEAGTMSGQSPFQRRTLTPQRAAVVAEAATMWGQAWGGDRRAALNVLEALSTSDLFRSATGDVLDRELLTRYQEITPVWSQFADRTTVRDFKPKKLVDLFGGRTALDLVPETTEYPSAVADAKEYEIKVGKFGRRFGHSWEASVNDDIDQLRTIPDAFSSAASLTEDRAAIGLFANPSTGAPNTAFFKSANGNAPVAAPLTSDALQDAITKVRTRKDTDGNVVTAPSLILVVGPAQEINARRILNATEIRTVVGDRTTIEANPLRGLVTLVVLDALPGLAWFLLPAPGSARPALTVAFLRGWETPDIRLKSSGSLALGGGEVPAADGSFEDDTVYYRVRHVVGAATTIPLHTYAGTGAA